VGSSATRETNSGLWLAILTDKDGAAHQDDVIQLLDSRCGILGTLELDDTAALGAAIVSQENIGVGDWANY
jgi:hypothetical protein